METTVIAATASDVHSIIISSIVYLLIKAKINIKTKIINTINVIFLESSFIFNCNGVSILSISFNDKAILPISVFFPVLITIPVHFPLVMLVPKKSMFFCS